MSIHYQLMQWNWLTMGSAAAKSNMRPADVPGTGKPCWMIRAVRKVTLNLLQMLLAPFNSHHWRRGSFREKSINPALHPDCYYLLWFKLSDWGHFLYVAICLLPEGIVERKEKKVNLTRKQGRSRVFRRQLAELMSGSP